MVIVAKEILFVCAGNTCRSPMAEFLLKQKRPDLKIRSAGTYAIRDSIMSPWTRKILEESGIAEKELNKFRTTLLNKDDLKKNNIIYAMSKDILEMIQFNGRETDVFLLNEENGGIPDPFGLGREEYEQVKSAILNSFEKMF